MQDLPEMKILPEAVYFDEQGDTRMLVRDGCDTYNKTFIVSSKALGFASDVWKKMQSGHFKEGQPGKDGMMTILLPHDEADALTVLLNIAHLRFDRLSRNPPPFDQLRALATLTDKYGATIMVRPWIKDWVGSLWGFGDWDTGQEEWLMIAWEYGHEDKFETLARDLTRYSGANEDGKLVTHAGRILDPYNEDCRFPPESIMSARKHVMDKMLHVLYDCVEQYLHKENVRICGNCNCDCKFLGYMIRLLSSVSLKLERQLQSSNTVSLSIEGLSSKIHETKDQLCQESDGHVCKNIVSILKLQLFIRGIQEDQPSAVLESHRVHMQRQKALLD
ncbi:hypothetical protein SLS58_004890 [Diplodia intermedia]|uniref:Nuclear pore protein n=1 Tax=Diplodia intermedia TaxID=856260 RepID=A0ABR3TSD5_9PEZI